MNASNYGAETLIKAARAAAEVFMATLDEAAGTVPPKVASGNAGTDELIEYDPLHDEPPFTADPKGTEAHMRMAYVTYLGAIGRLNAEEGRGANPEEISEFAKRAGYSGGNAVNGWNSRAGSPRTVENMDGARFLNDAGLKGITKDAAKIGIKIVGQIATVPEPE